MGPLPAKMGLCMRFFHTEGTTPSSLFCTFWPSEAILAALGTRDENVMHQPFQGTLLMG